MSPAAIRAAFERFGDPSPESEGLWVVFVDDAVFPRVCVVEKWAGELWWVKDDNHDPLLPGLYLPLARLLAGLEVAESLIEDEDEDDSDGDPTIRALSDALATYRSTR
jgi:hypothetical protein